MSLARSVALWLSLPGLLTGVVRLQAADPDPENPGPRVWPRLQNVASVQEWQVRRDSIVSSMEAVTGSLPDRTDRPPIDANVLEQEDRAGHIRQTVRFTSEPGDDLTVYVYVPKGLREGSVGPGSWRCIRLTLLERVSLTVRAIARTGPMRENSRTGAMS